MTAPPAKPWVSQNVSRSKRALDGAEDGPVAGGREDADVRETGLARHRGGQQPRDVVERFGGQEFLRHELPVVAIGERIIELSERSVHAPFAAVVGRHSEEKRIAAEVKGEVPQVAGSGAGRLGRVIAIVPLLGHGESVAARSLGNELPQAFRAGGAHDLGPVAALDQRQVVEQRG